MNCKKNNCCTIIDDLLEQIQYGLGKVDYDKIDEYIDEKIGELREDISNGDLSIDIDEEDLAQKIRALITGEDIIDAYNVTYKDTTVGAKLDELDKVGDELKGTIQPLRDFIKGEILYNYPVYFSFNKELKKLTVITDNANVTTFNLDVSATRYEIPVLSQDTTVVVKGTSFDDEEVTLTVKAKFFVKYYVGCCGSERLTNSETTALNSYCAKEGVTEYSHIFHPIGKQYLWWVFPANLHTDYDFFNNGFMDSNYVWYTGNLTNEYGYTSPYIFIRSGSVHTSSNIYTEVKAHEHK